MTSMKSVTTNLVSSNMVTSPCISSTNLETAFLSQPYSNTITTTNNNNYISSTSSSLSSNNNNSSNSNFNTICMFSSIDPSIVQTELIGLSMNDVTCSEVTSSSPLLHDLEGIEVLGEHSLGDHNLGDHHLGEHHLGDHNLLPASLADSPGLSSPDTLDSTYITLSNLRPHSAYSDVSSLSGRDDVSSPSSIFSSFEASSMGGCISSRGNDLKKKKGPAPRQQEDLCLVCGDRASGYHYNALTCEGCKGFFRRSITKKAVYQCKFGSECDIDMYMRRKCQECRFKKCIRVGMREECVIPEVQCRIKREQKKARETEKGKDVPSPGADSSSSQVQSPGSMISTNSGLSAQSFNDLSHNAIVSSLNAPYYDDMNNSVSHIPSSTHSESHCVNPAAYSPPVSDHLTQYTDHKLTSEQAEIINKLLYNQDHYEIPTAENLPWYKSAQGVNDSLKKLMEETLVGEKTMRISHMLDMTLKTVQLIVEFAKRVPGFETLMQDDQIELLKPTSSEIMMLRAARRYDLATDSIVYCNNYPYKRDVYDVAGLMDANTDHLFRFCKNLATWKVDNAEYALLTAIVLFSERPRLKEPHAVEKLQEIYLKILEKYVQNKNKKTATTRFAKLLSCLTELRTLAYLNNVQCQVIHNEKQTLPSLLCNMWDVQQDEKGGKEDYM